MSAWYSAVSLAKHGTLKMKVLVYNCKFPLTKGIFEVEIGEIEEVSGKTAYFDGRNLFYLGRDWAYTLEGAKDIAREAQDNKIKSLEKQLAKVKKLNFS